MKLMLHVAPGIVRYPLIASVILETRRSGEHRESQHRCRERRDRPGSSSEKCMEVKEAFERRGVKVVPLEIPVIRDENECVHCGACVSICPTGTFRFEDWRVVADSGKCIQCGACVMGCPQRALKLVLK